MMIIGSVFFAATTSAYVLPGPYLVQKMKQRIGSFSRLEIVADMQIYDDHGQIKATAGVTDRYWRSGRFRSELRANDLWRIHVSSNNNAVIVLNGHILSEVESWMDKYKDLFLYGTSSRLLALLQDTGIDTGTTSIGRMGEKLVYIIGAVYPDMSRPQLWLDKETFLPARWILVPSGTEDADPVGEIRYLLWQRKAGVFFPGRIAFLSNGKIKREMIVTVMKFPPVFPAAIFDVSEIRHAYSNVARDGSSRAPRLFGDDQPPVDDKIDEIDQSIESFGKIFQ